MPPAIKSKAERIQAIIDAAVEECLASGYEGATLEAIGLRCGMTRPAILRYFPNKSALLNAVCERLLTPLYDMMNSAGQQPDAARAIHIFLTDYLNFFAGHPAIAQLYLLDRASTLSQQRFSHPRRDLDTQLRVWLHMTLTWGVEAGDFRQHDSAALTTTFVFALEGAMIKIAHRKHSPVKKVVRQLESSLLDHLTLPD